MADRRNNIRRLTPRGIGMAVLGVLTGVALSAAYLVIWHNYVITDQQSSLLGVYVKAHYPWPSNMKAVDVTARLAEVDESIANVVTKSASRHDGMVSRRKVRALFQDQYFHKPLADFLMPAVIPVLAILILSVSFGLGYAAYQMRKMQDEDPLRGPEIMTEAEFNKTRKGAVIELRVD